ncbi:hypothetical protein QBC38DRAFT_243772 [Podospora fimiseda]|uniref:Uncharacterized protein n=1 Tax=Podospora fimiseda TaxID=252190 RepID=A0AAN7BXI2_9PEZI|nr:hypothetical protein QBC38DRAFT_243772 [Podospora fimiseda]
MPLSVPVSVIIFDFYCSILICHGNDCLSTCTLHLPPATSPDLSVLLVRPDLPVFLVPLALLIFFFLIHFPFFPLPQSTIHNHSPTLRDCPKLASCIIQSCLTWPRLSLKSSRYRNSSRSSSSKVGIHSESLSTKKGLISGRTRSGIRARSPFQQRVLKFSHVRILDPSPLSLERYHSTQRLPASGRPPTELYNPPSAHCPPSAK